MIRTFPIECDQQTIQQAVLDCLEVNKLLSELHNQQSSEYGTRRIGRVLTTCRNIEIFLRKIMEEEFKSRNTSTMSRNANTMSSNANTMSSNANTLSSNANTLSSNHVSLSVAK